MRQNGVYMFERIASPLITQLRTPYFTVDCGMSYLIRLGDGRFVMIDGNIGEYDEPDYLMRLLSQQNVTAAKPTIAAWIITHPHGDHFFGMVNFCEKYANDVVIEKMIFKFPVAGRCGGGSDTSAFFAMLDTLDTLEGTEIITPSTGDRYTFADATFDVLFTYTDLDPAPIPDINDTSVVMRMELCGHRAMWLGDIGKQASDNICARFSIDELKSDIMQVGHHGYTGGSDELYRAIDPEVILWPCPDFWYHPAKTWKCNDYIVHSSKNIKATFVSGQTEAVLDLTKPILPPEPYKAGKISAPFEKKSMLSLNWTCLTGGGRGYLPMKLSFPEGGGCRLLAGDARSLCQLIQRGQTALSERYVFTFSGVLDEGAEMFGLIWNYPTPMKWVDEALLVLDQQSGVPFRYTLTVDKAKKYASLYEGDRLVMETNELSDEPCDIILLMKNASVSLNEVTFENLG